LLQNNKHNNERLLKEAHNLFANSLNYYTASILANGRISIVIHLMQSTDKLTQFQKIIIVRSTSPLVYMKAGFRYIRCLLKSYIICVELFKLRVTWKRAN